MTIILAHKFITVDHEYIIPRRRHCDTFRICHDVQSLNVTLQFQLEYKFEWRRRYMRIYS